MHLTLVAPAPVEHRRGAAVQLTVLAAAAYVYAVAEMAPIGAMPAIAADLHVAEAHVGMLTAAYAFVSVIATVPLVRATAHWPRRRVFLLTLVCLAVSQALSALSPGLLLLGASRVLCAATHGLMWSIVVPIGARLLPPNHTGRAATAVYVGTSAALVVGNPMTTWLSQAWGWRPTVGAVAVAAAVVAVLARLALPRMADATTVAAPNAARGPYLNPRLITLCVLTTIGVSAHFASYTFIVPIVRDVVGVGGHDENWLLGAYGIAGLVTMVVLARAVDRRLFTTVIGSLSALCLAFWVLSSPATGMSVAVGALAVVAWGASAAALPPMLQSAAIRTCAEQPERASALYVTAFQIGILLGSVNGGLVYGHLGLAAVIVTSAALFAVTLIGAAWRRDTFPL
ncbi:MAG: MFS transporter [Mycobacterium sp.]